MLARTLRSLVALATVVVAYQVYALVVTPLVEPPIARRAAAQSTAEERSEGRDRVRRYQDVLAHYFPADHWTQTRKPTVIESGPLMLVVGDHSFDDRGGLELVQCVVVMFPKIRMEGVAPPREAVVLEAPGGARLQFDKAFDFTGGGVGRLIGGSFPGKITVRSDMKELGPHDDLRMQLEDLELTNNGLSLVSDAPVRARLGGSKLAGRRLEITFQRDEYSQPDEGGLGIDGIQSIELFYDVRIALQVGSINPLRDVPPAPDERMVTRPIKRTAYTLPLADANSWVSGGEPERASVYAAADGASLQPVPAPSSAPAQVLVEREVRPATPDPPVEIACDGALRFDLVDYVASLERNVRVWQLNFEGQSDQMDCQELLLHFGAGDASEDGAFSELGRRQRKELPLLRPRLLVAIGDEVKVDSPTRDAHVRCNRLEYLVEQRQVTLMGRHVSLAQAANEVHAGYIRYRHPAEGSRAAIGELWVKGGGWLRAIPNDAEPERFLQAEWKQEPGVDYSVELVRGDQGPVLSVFGAPKLAAAPLGQITSQAMHLYLRETPADGPDGPAIELVKQRNGGEPALALLPERLVATGAVQIDSPRLTGRTNELITWFRAGEPTTTTGVQSRTSLVGDRSGSQPGEDTASSAYDLSARSVRLEVAFNGKDSSPTQLVCEGDVAFRETRTRRPEDAPFEVYGHELVVEDIDTEVMQLHVHGDADSGAAGAMSIVKARGATMHARDLHLDQGKNRLWSDGAGRAEITTKKDLLGGEGDGPAVVNVTWRNGLVFDGRRLAVKGDVIAEGPHDRLECPELAVVTSRHVDFKDPGSDDPVEVERVEARGGVRIDHRTVDAEGQQSHERAEIQTLSVNQQSGEISGDGPGWIRSVHLTTGDQSFGSLAGKPKAAEKAEPAAAKLHYLRVDFLRGISGNIHQRIVRFHERVEAVYGPVDAWQQELPLNRPGGPTPGTAQLSSNELQVYEDPAVRYAGGTNGAEGTIGPIVLMALGAVQLEAATEDQGVIVAQADTASYSQQKDLFALEGSPGTMLRQQQAGQPYGAVPFRRLDYWMKERRLTMESGGAADLRLPPGK